MSKQLFAAARSLENKGAASKAVAESMTAEALDANNTAKLQLAAFEAMRGTIYQEVAASLREAASISVS